ncbi:TIGR03557 family F420-dependent LLM class oxidoreductase [Brachybacterium sp. GCM10030267]|uniref:TIGR03557 family F420-dependent LLM class oxidoreductase n=1 Tax=Brachybacterium sp. GCM10030267 TaxID=3273381 RepID=UPI0036081B4F
MTIIGYHASHEQIAPSTLLADVQRAEAVGFDAALCSDHLAPWGTAQGESGFAWSWLGAAMASTTLPFGVVTAPGQRYHPVVIAQAVATLAEMFPGRFWAAYGSGEAVNEHVTADPWPDKDTRRRRVTASVEAIRRLLEGEQVDLDDVVRIHQARIWSRPATQPPAIAASASPDSARWAARWADGMITVGIDPQSTSQVLSAYRDAGGTGETMLQAHVSLAPSEDEALAIATDQWKHATASATMWDVEQPEDFDALAEPTPEAMRSSVAIAGSVEQLAGQLTAAGRGFDHLYIHHVGQDQSYFLDRADDLISVLKETL